MNDCILRKIISRTIYERIRLTLMNTLIRHSYSFSIVNCNQRQNGICLLYNMNNLVIVPSINCS